MIPALIGGVLIGLAAIWMYASLGRVAGISGIFSQALRAPFSNASWAMAFVVGLGAGGWLVTLLVGARPQEMPFDAVLLLVGGVIVGFGTRLGSGCTSGHGVCGVARLSRRSIVATCIFVALGMVTGTLLHGVLS